MYKPNRNARAQQLKAKRNAMKEAAMKKASGNSPYAVKAQSRRGGAFAFQNGASETAEVPAEILSVRFEERVRLPSRPVFSVTRMGSVRYW